MILIITLYNIGVITAKDTEVTLHRRSYKKVF